jgi:dTDP-4-amino-4,6-dideoxygalactose transaminase
MAALRTVCEIKNLHLFIDAAQSIGATWNGSRAAALADGAAMSFYPTKNLGALDDAGAVMTPHADLAETVRSLRNYGKNADGAHERTGVNARLGELQAAVLRLRLPKVEAENQQRAHLAELYRQYLAGAQGLRLPALNPASAWHLFAVRILPPRDRDKIAEALRDEHGIGTAVHYREAFTDCPAFCPKKIFSHAGDFARTTLSLPLHPHLSEQDVDQVCHALKSLLNNAGSSA